MNLKNNLYQTIKTILQTARNNAYKLMVEEEQKGEKSYILKRIEKEKNA